MTHSPIGAKASAIIYSIIESAKENDLNPYTYLTHLFEQLPYCTTAELNALLSYFATLPESYRVQTKAKV